MSIQFQLRRGTTSQIQAITPAAGEILYDTSRHTAVVGDGSQAGGYPFPSLTSAGWVGIGVAVASSPLTISYTNTDPASSLNGINHTWNNTLTANNSNQLNGLSLNISGFIVPSGVTYSGGISGIRLDGFINTASFAGAISSSMTAIWARSGILLANASASVTTSQAVLAEIRNDIVGATVTNLYGFRVAPATIAGNGSLLAAFYAAGYSITGTYTSVFDFYGSNSFAKNYFAGQIWAGTGGASAPAYSFNADTNTGMFDVSADIIGWACGGTEMARLNGSGHFLIGTTVDNGHLTIGGNAMPEADNTRNLGSASFRWANSFVAQLVATKARITTSQTPATSGAAGTQGDFAWDSGFFYICTATNTWRRVAHASW